jgi:uncharacterized membrane protein
VPTNSKDRSPTYPPPLPAGLTPVLDRNIEALQQRRKREECAASWQERVADAITRFGGSMLFVYIHVTVFGFWIVANLHWIPGVPSWDDSFVVLAMIASVEAIFLSTFVLITQNRMAAAADKRADLDLQISLLTEHELTRIATLLIDMAKKMGVKTEVDEELKEVQQDVAPDAVLDERKVAVTLSGIIRQERTLRVRAARCTSRKPSSPRNLTVLVLAGSRAGVAPAEHARPI